MVKLDGQVVDEGNLRSVHIFIGAYMLIMLLAVLLVSLDDFSMVTNFSAVASCIGNVGPGLEGVGPMSSYAAYSGFSKLVLSMCMIIGRLELLPVMVLFSAFSFSMHSPLVLASTFFVFGRPFSSYPMTIRPSQRPSFLSRTVPSPFFRFLPMVSTPLRRCR